MANAVQDLIIQLFIPLFIIGINIYHKSNIDMQSPPFMLIGESPFSYPHPVTEMSFLFSLIGFKNLILTKSKTANFLSVGQTGLFELNIYSYDRDLREFKFARAFWPLRHLAYTFPRRGPLRDWPDNHESGPLREK